MRVEVWSVLSELLDGIRVSSPEVILGRPGQSALGGKKIGHVQTNPKDIPPRREFRRRHSNQALESYAEGRFVTNE